MDVGSWPSNIGYTARLVIDVVPDAFWIAYYWVRDWQGLVVGILLIFAAQIFSQRSIRAARIRATAMIRAAQIAAGVSTPNGTRSDLPKAITALGPATIGKAPSSQTTLLQKVEQTRSLVRSAMSTLTSNLGRADLAPNFFCQRIAQLQFSDAELPAEITPAALQVFRKFTAQLAEVRQAVEHNSPHAELSPALVQLNSCAREFAASIADPGFIGADNSARQRRA